MKNVSIALVFLAAFGHPVFVDAQESSPDEAVPVDLDSLNEESASEDAEEAVDLDSLDDESASASVGMDIENEPMLPFSTDVPEREHSPWAALLALGGFLLVSAMFLPPVKRSRGKARRLENVKRKAA